MIDPDGMVALAALDRALDAKPERDGAAFVEATERLCAMRARLVVKCRAGAALRPDLLLLNGIISSTLGGHFPLGPVPWTSIEQARSALDRLLKRASGLL